MEGPSNRILVVGKSCLDLATRLTDIPKVNQVHFVDSYHFSAGGSGLNTAVALKRMGERVDLWTRLGRDPAADFIKWFLREEGVRVFGQSDYARLTSMSLINLDENGELGILQHPGAASHLSPRGSPGFPGGKPHQAVHFAGFNSMLELSGGSLRDILLPLRNHHIVTSLTTNRLQSRKVDLKIAAPNLDIIFLNEHEAVGLSKEPTFPSAALELLRWGFQHVIITLGGKGAYLATRRRKIHRPAFIIAPRDTTGAGDAFTAGFLYGRLQGYESRKCLDMGNAAGCLCSRVPGPLLPPLGSSELKKMVSLRNRVGDIAALVLAGGTGSRMRIPGQKLLLHLGRRSIVEWVIRALRLAGVPRIILLLGHRGEEMESALAREPVEFQRQTGELRGTGEAVRQALPHVAALPNQLVIVNGDVPLLKPSTIRDLVIRQAESASAVTLLSATSPSPSRYGHAIVNRDAQGHFRDIEHHSRVPALKYREVSTGTYSFSLPHLLEAAEHLQQGHKGKVHLSDCLKIMRFLGHGVEVCPSSDFWQFISVNTSGQLGELRSLLEERRNESNH